MVIVIGKDTCTDWISGTGLGDLFSCRKFRTQETGISDKKIFVGMGILGKFSAVLGGKWPVRVGDYYPMNISTLKPPK